MRVNTLKTISRWQKLLKESLLVLTGDSLIVLLPLQETTLFQTLELMRILEELLRLSEMLKLDLDKR